jgi:hypothetical protein
MKCRHGFLVFALIIIQIPYLASCITESYNSNRQAEKIGFLEFYLDIENLKVKNIRDSLINLDVLKYVETTDELGNIHKDLYYDFSGTGPLLYAKVNLKGSYIVDERLTNIQLTLCHRSDTSDQSFSYKCDLDEIKKLFEVYREEYGDPNRLEQGEKYEWLAKRIPIVYSPGETGRLAKDEIYIWEKGNYIIYFDFGYPDGPIASNSQISQPPDSTTAPIIYYDFTQDYIDELLEHASGKAEGDFK